MVLNSIGASAIRRPSGMSRSAGRREPLETLEHRALVPVTAVDHWESHLPYSRRPSAPFLAHLIATESGEPQTRHRRRAEPETAARAYEAMLRLTALN
jgi:hypothetical protein